MDTSFRFKDTDLNKCIINDLQLWVGPVLQSGITAMARQRIWSDVLQRSSLKPLLPEPEVEGVDNININGESAPYQNDPVKESVMVEASPGFTASEVVRLARTLG